MEKTRLILSTGAVTGLALLVILGLINLNHDDMARLDIIDKITSRAPHLPPLSKNASYTASLDNLVQQPIFIMTTGISAYTEKAIQLFGISITSGRRAALVAIDGAEPVWLSMGQFQNDVQLLDVSATSARFDTPIGVRTIGINDPAPSVTNNGAMGMQN